MDDVKLRSKATSAYDCSIGEIGGFRVGDAGGPTSVVLLELPADDGFMDGTESGIILVADGISVPVPDGMDDGYVGPVDGLKDEGLKITGFDVAGGGIGSTVGEIDVQFAHRNKTAQS